MKLLLDTHIFLWFIIGDERLPERFQKEIRLQENEVYLSVVSLWEIIVRVEPVVTQPAPPQIRT